MTLVGIPAMDPVLKRAQFNQKINSMTVGVGVGDNKNNNNNNNNNNANNKT